MEFVVLQRGSRNICAMEPSRWWGDDRAIFDDEEARRRILDAAGRCIVERGNTQFRMGEVADAAGVSRSTVYRYFPARDDVLLGLILMRVDHALGELVRSLAAPDDPVRSVPEMVLARVESVDGDPLNEALFAAESTTVATALEKGSEPPSWRRCCAITSRCWIGGRRRAACTPTSTRGRWSSGCMRQRCFSWRPRGGTARPPTNASSSSSSW
jgi:AcrR family transcriptional regulator